MARKKFNTMTLRLDPLQTAVINGLSKLSGQKPEAVISVLLAVGITKLRAMDAVAPSSPGRRRRTAR